MKILEYSGLDTQRVAAAYRKVCDAIAQGDFHAAQVRKLAQGSLHGNPCYRARLNDADRLLFVLIRHGDEICALMLEVIAHHRYDTSRFLRGARIDPEHIDTGEDVNAEQALSAARQTPPLRYLHPERRTVQLLDKPLSFDDAQDAIYRQAPPLILVGSAGSGKTALTLEKLKHATGEVLYVTHSTYLAQSARDQYHAHGYEHLEQDAVFLSYREFIESIRVPPGREATWHDFTGWFARIRQAFRAIDPHQAFEEIRGVIAASADGVLSRAAYQALGVRQSIFPVASRSSLYDLFEKYRAWLDDAGLYDLSLVAQAWRPLATARYDFVVVDGVQDLTPAQLALVLAILKKADRFLLCGDSNQIVHPNFFSWSQVKSLFWRDTDLARRQGLAVLSANFRNSQRATRIANTLLKIKHQRFGSIDRESNFLVDAVGGEPGELALLAEQDGALRDLDASSRRSTRFAVLVLRDEDKAAARQRFATPLLFSIHEAKGLEYDNIVLYRFISDNRQAFSDIVEGVSKADLIADELAYRRARDKEDKSLEIYKFFVNALYVALTRATRNLYLVESDTRHPLFDLLDLTPGVTAKVETARSSLEDWQKEARKLELQGKHEQAEAIRRDILRQSPVPWPVIDEGRLRELMLKTFGDQAPGNKHKQTLYEYATCHDEPELARHLLSDTDFGAARNFKLQRSTLGRKTWMGYFQRNFKDILRQCDQHGVEHRLPMNQTPLMAAAAAGNVALVEALLERGANRENTDHYGWNALHWALREAQRDPVYARSPFAAIFERVAPSTLDVNFLGRLLRIDRSRSEYLLFQTLWMLFRNNFNTSRRKPTAAFETADILNAWQHLPVSVLRPERNKRQHISNVLARNEMTRDYLYNRRLFLRLETGWYIFAPHLSVRHGHSEESGSDAWMPIYHAFNLPLITEFARLESIAIAANLAKMCGVTVDPRPLIKRVALTRAEEAVRAQEAAERLRDEARQRRKASRLQPVADTPTWGTPQAKAREIERIRAEIAARHAAEAGKKEK